MENIPKQTIICTLPSENTSPNTTPNPEIDIMSSILDAAITSVEIPLLSPYPLSLRLNNVGTTTAGLTALNTNLKRRKLNS